MTERSLASGDEAEGRQDTVRALMDVGEATDVGVGVGVGGFY